MFDITPMLSQPFGIVASVQNASKPQWMQDFDDDKYGTKNPSKNPSSYSSWDDFKRVIGLTKEQYLKGEGKLGEGLSQIKVAGQLYRYGQY